MSEPLHPGTHPDADSLSAFLEGVLPENERLQCLSHFAECSRCREVVFLAQEPPPVPAAPGPAPAWRRWYAPIPVMSGAAATCLLVTGIAIYLRQTPTPAEPRLVAQVAPANSGPAAPPEMRADAPTPAPVVPKRRFEARVRSAPEPAAPAKPAPPSEPAAVARPMLGAVPGPPVSVSAQAPLIIAEPTLPPLAPAVPMTVPPPVSAASEPPPLSIGSGVGGGRRGPAVAVSEIAGSVTDSSGAAVPGASVSVLQIAGNLTRKTKADTDGRFRVASLPAGKYELQITSPGFREERRQVEVTADRPAVVASTLSVGAVTESVEVSAANATIAITNPGPRPLPGRLPASVTIISGKITLAMDSAGALFVSSNAGKSWKIVKPVWQGKAVQLISVASPTAAFQLTTESGSVWLSRDGAHWFLAPQ